MSHSGQSILSFSLSGVRLLASAFAPFPNNPHRYQSPCSSLIRPRLPRIRIRMNWALGSAHRVVLAYLSESDWPGPGTGGWRGVARRDGSKRVMVAWCGVRISDKWWLALLEFCRARAFSWRMNKRISLVAISPLSFPFPFVPFVPSPLSLSLSYLSPSHSTTSYHHHITFYIVQSCAVELSPPP